MIAHGRHSMMGLYFCKNIAEQCDGNINLGYTSGACRVAYNLLATLQRRDKQFPN